MTALAALALALASACPAQLAGPEKTGQWSSDEAQAQADFSPVPGTALPLRLRFRDETGQTVELSRFFGARPVLLQFVYYRCAALCPMAQNGLLRALRALSLSPGRDFEQVVVSVNPAETPAEASARRKLFLSRYRREGAERGVHYLVGQAGAVDRLTRAAGFRFAYDPSSEQFAHATGVLALTPDGRVSRFLSGIEPAPSDVRLALVEASAGRLGTIKDRLVLLCYQYDPTKRGYGAAVIETLRALGALTVLCLVALVGWLSLRERGTEARP